MSNRSHVELEPLIDDQTDPAVSLNPKPKIPPESQPDEETAWDKFRWFLDKLSEYAEAFIGGFLGPGWPAFLSAFILHIMHPMTLAAYIFFAACVFTGLLSMGIKAFYNTVDENSDRVKAAKKLGDVVTAELARVTDGLEHFKGWVQKQAIIKQSELNISTHECDKRFAQYTKSTLNRDKVTYLKEADVAKIVKRAVDVRDTIKAAADSADQLAGQFMRQSAWTIVAALITFVGVAGLPFFMFLTVNAVVMPLPTALILTATVFACGYGIVHCVKFIQGKYQEFNARKAAIKELRELQGSIDQSIQAFQARSEDAMADLEELEKCYFGGETCQPAKHCDKTDSFLSDGTLDAVVKPENAKQLKKYLEKVEPKLKRKVNPPVESEPAVKKSRDESHDRSPGVSTERARKPSSGKPNAGSNAGALGKFGFRLNAASILSDGQSSLNDNNNHNPAEYVPVGAGKRHN